MTVWQPVHAPGLSMSTAWPEHGGCGVAVWRQGGEWVSCRIGESAEDRTHDIERHGSDMDEARREALALWCPR